MLATALPCPGARHCPANHQEHQPAAGTSATLAHLAPCCSIVHLVMNWHGVAYAPALMVISAHVAPGGTATKRLCSVPGLKSTWPREMLEGVGLVGLRSTCGVGSHEVCQDEGDAGLKWLEAWVKRGSMICMA